MPKILSSGEKKTNDNVKPFTKVEFHFAHARFFKENDVPKEIMLSTMTSTGKGATKNYLQVPKKDILTHLLKEDEGK